MSNQSTDSLLRRSFQKFLHSEVSGSIVLMAATVLALAWANSPWAASYKELVSTYVGVKWGDAVFKLSLQHWVNDLLMVLFFFVVGLEIKREVMIGELSSRQKALLPVAAALGGMVVPAGIYWALNGSGVGADGWGIPMATDIAFALGILATLGRRIPVGLKIFLTALAIADDLGAVMVIAVFYTSQISLGALALAALGLMLLALAGRLDLRQPWIYVVLGLGVWAAVLASGVHATVAGILVALTIPVRATISPERFWSATEDSLGALRDSDLSRDSMIDDRRQLAALGTVQETASRMMPAGLVLEERLHPVQAFVVLPLFAFFNAGLALNTGLPEPLAVPLGIVLGLVVGKPVGIVLCSWLAVRSGSATLPVGVTWRHIAGAGLLAGVGFTMSLFISDLAFATPELKDGAKLGILAASLVAGIVGWLVLVGARSRS